VIQQYKNPFPKRGGGDRGKPTLAKMWAFYFAVFGSNRKKPMYYSRRVAYMG
jgi:hypothetical protein